MRDSVLGVLRGWLTRVTPTNITVLDHLMKPVVEQLLSRSCSMCLNAVRSNVVSQVLSVKLAGSSQKVKSIQKFEEFSIVINHLFTRLAIKVRSKR